MDNDRKLEFIVEHYTRLMHSCANSILMDYHESEDACQEAFIKLYRIIDRIEHVENRDARAYCVATVRNIALDMAKKKNRQIPVETVFEDPDAYIERNDYNCETEEMILEIRELPEIYRTIIKKRCFEQKSARETAIELNTKVTTVNSRLKRARELLKKKWESASSDISQSDAFGLPSASPA